MTTISKNTSSAAGEKSGSGLIAKGSKPDKLTLCSYQMGFGDCYLLTFHYGAEARHVLIDFGSTAKPKDAPSDLMLRVANDIKKRCGGKLHILVATHRHKDHISGFATNKAGTASGDIIRSCNPDLVMQPWTEDPDAPVDAAFATTTSAGKSIAFSKTLSNMQAVAEAIRNEARLLGKSRELAGLADQLGFLGEDNISNRSAIDNLIEMGKNGQAMYVSADLDNPLDLDDLLPGVTVRVLGPPNLQQSKKITKMRDEDAAEFWQFSADAGKAIDNNGEAKPLFQYIARRDVAQLIPPHTRWFIRRMDAIRGTQMLEIVRILDSVMNNTSIILHFEVGGKKLLFPGDAQIENWSYALDKAQRSPEFRKLLEDVDVFKVGHHGSRNANPKSLWEMFKKKNFAPSDKRLQTFVSTMEGKHGNRAKKTEVPRLSLVDALQSQSNYFTTQELKKDELCREFTINLQ
ncbi:MAG: hypothetical protein M3384_03590 [Acidobacteriota bacterium]|nr:hypothetical protein [Acidobacteriota bacterium]